ncbi:SET domain-containing protein [Bradyrhizobium sp.]|uniref:SET domain-containing protein n=1 Tax=Bradyrhizobium sp. TaxID=376 RepID=UPI0025BC1928|nr:SET domain-containing protein [Bradyrhizobium sp.]
MSTISSKKPYRVGRSRTGLGLFATKRIKKGTRIVRYLGPLLDCKKKKDDAIENKYLFQLNDRWTIDGSVRANVARYINHACKPNAESEVRPRKRKVFIRAIKNIEPGDEINYDYGTEYFKAYLKPIGCKCAACEKKRKKQRAEARAERARLKAKAERKAKKKAEKLAKAKEKLKEQLKKKKLAKTLTEKRARAERAPNKKLNGHSSTVKSLNGNSRVRVTDGKPAGATRQASVPAHIVPVLATNYPPILRPDLAGDGSPHSSAER